MPEDVAALVGRVGAVCAAEGLLARMYDHVTVVQLLPAVAAEGLGAVGTREN